MSRTIIASDAMMSSRARILNCVSLRVSSSARSATRRSDSVFSRSILRVSVLAISCVFSCKFWPCQAVVLREPDGSACYLTFEQSDRCNDSEGPTLILHRSFVSRRRIKEICADTSKAVVTHVMHSRIEALKGMHTIITRLYRSKPQALSHVFRC